ncbi:MAG: LPXTG cell wall anchor domain-containing protein [Actinobacteria bacterium]|nr:LPXTG cell wall anchor domain-containing protein [Actinomycetota bacterium]
MNSRDRARVVAGGITALAVLVSLAGLTLTTTRAVAVYRQITETGRPGYLRLAVDSSTPLQRTLGPGESMSWLVEASLDDARAGRLSLELRGSGGLVDTAGMTASVLACAGGFDTAAALGGGAYAVAPSCRGQAVTVVPTTAVAALSHDAERFSLAELRRGHPRQLLVTLSIPATTGSSLVASRTARIGLGLQASENSSGSPTEPPELPRTGAEADARALIVLAAGLIGIGGGAVLWRRSGRRVP